MNETTITLEQVEHLKRTADVRYDEPREAQIQADGDLLEAMIWLERQGKTQGGVSSYSTREGQSAGPQVEQAERRFYTSAQLPEKRPGESPAFWQKLKRWLLDNRLEAYHQASGNEIQIPVGIAAILLLLSFWFAAIILVVGFCFGWRYRFAGPDLNREDVNQVMEGINDTAGDVVTNVKNTWNSNINKRK